MKTFLTKNLLLAFFMFAFAGLAIGQIGTPLGSIILDDDGNGDCEAFIKIKVLLANLEDNGNGVYTLPQGYYDMYLKYSINGQPIQYILLNEFSFNQTINNIPVYEIEINLGYIDICEPCIGNDGLPIEIPYLAELTTSGLIESTPPDIEYPACNHTSEFDIFSCTVFVDVPSCSSISHCNNNDFTDLSGSIEYQCPGEIVEDPGDEGERPRNSNNSNTSTKQDPSIEAYPNPFKENLEIRWSEADNIESISLVDTNGKLINFWQRNQLERSTSLDINSNKLSKGLYFVKVKYTDSTKVLKVVKQ